MSRQNRRHRRYPLDLKGVSRAAIRHCESNQSSGEEISALYIKLLKELTTSYLYRANQLQLEFSFRQTRFLKLPPCLDIRRREYQTEGRVQRPGALLSSIGSAFTAILFYLAQTHLPPPRHTVLKSKFLFQ